MKKEEVYLTYLMLVPEKGMKGVVENPNDLVNIQKNVDYHFLKSVLAIKRGEKLSILGTEEKFRVVGNLESAFKFLNKGLYLVYPSETVGIRIDDTDKGIEIIYNYLKDGKDAVTKSIDDFYFDGMDYYTKLCRQNGMLLRKKQF